MIAFSLLLKGRRVAPSTALALYLRLAAAARPHLGAAAADELARTVAGWDDKDVTEEQIGIAIEHRRLFFGLVVEDEAADAAAREMAASWWRGEL